MKTLFKILLLFGMTIAQATEIKCPLHYEHLITKYAKQYEIEPALAFTFVNMQSGFNAQYSGIRGICGLTAVEEVAFLSTSTSKNATLDTALDALSTCYEPEANLQVGLEEFKKRLDDDEDPFADIMGYSQMGRPIGGFIPSVEFRVEKARDLHQCYQNALESR